MRIFALALGAPVLLSLGLFACTTNDGGTTADDSQTALPTRQPPSSGSASGGAGSSGDPTDGGGGSGSSSGSSGSSTGGPDAGVEGGGGGGGTACLAGSTAETESNDTPETANELGAGTSFCGKLPVGDVDHVAFVLPADTKEFGWGATWSVNGAAFEITAEGQTTPVGDAPPFFPGKTYVIKASTTAKTALDYRVDLKIVR